MLKISNNSFLKSEQRWATICHLPLWPKTPQKTPMDNVFSRYFPLLLHLLDGVTLWVSTIPRDEPPRKSKWSNFTHTIEWRENFSSSENNKRATQDHVSSWKTSFQKRFHIFCLLCTHWKVCTSIEFPGSCGEKLANKNSLSKG